MRALLLEKICNLNSNSEPLVLKEIPEPIPSNNELLIKVSACGVCHTEIDEIEGRTPPPKFPIVLGHQVVGRVVQKGKDTSKFELNDRVGVGWFFFFLWKM